MRPICGKPALQIMIERLSEFKNNLYVVTTDDGSEEPIIDLCRDLEIPFFQGDTDNVLERYYRGALEFGADNNSIIVRLTSDCPMYCPEILEPMLRAFEVNKLDYFSNTMDRTYPRGLDSEIFNFSSLKKAYKEATTPFDKEHVTPYIYKTKPSDFKIGQFSDSENNSNFRVTLDEVLDYEVIIRLYHELGCRTDFTYSDLLETLKNNPAISKLNQYVGRRA